MTRDRKRTVGRDDYQNTALRFAGLNYMDATKTFPCYKYVKRISTTVVTNSNIVCSNGNARDCIHHIASGVEPRY
jgi:hypothetical protein